MCGIYGIVHFDGSPVDPALLSRMGQASMHRGPDDEGLHCDHGCGIGMRRLSIIDLTGGHQPLTNFDGTLWLVANGEIYNFRNLRQELERSGHQFKSASDCETILHAYAQYGDDSVLRLNGMFGFALWDSERRRLLIGRDRLGIKPVYIYQDSKRLIFASEAKAILSVTGIGAAIDYTALDAYLNHGYIPAPYSIFRGIRKLPPATLLTVECGRVREHRYWRIPNEIDESIKEEDWCGLLRERLAGSVRMQMVSDVPIGAFLSGGIDSSAVVAFMARSSSTPIKTYAIGFDGGPAERLYNELPFARRVAGLFGTAHREIVVRPDVVTLLPHLLWHMDEPIADTAFITTYLVSQFARQDVTVILSGVGGDELFGGYRRYLGDYYQSYLDRLPLWVKRAVVRLGQELPSDRHSRALNGLRYAKSFLAASSLSFEARYRSYVEVFSDDASTELLRVQDLDRSSAFAAAFREAHSPDALNRMLAVDAETQLPDDLLLLTDKMSMAVSLECRVPLLDHELVELAARIPQQIKIRGGRLKHAMKRALEGILPQDILNRPKRGFGTPMGAWLKHELAPVLRSVLSPSAVAERGLFRYDAIRELIASHAASRVDGTDRLLSLLNLEIWCRVYLDGRTANDVTAELQEAA